MTTNVRHGYRDGARLGIIHALQPPASYAGLKAAARIAQGFRARWAGWAVGQRDVLAGQPTLNAPFGGTPAMVVASPTRTGDRRAFP